jgi:ferritin-like metal-binding protein YciE
MPDTLDEQLTKYLTDAHSIELQALAQLRRAPDIAGDPELARVFADHLHETEEHERLVRGRLEARGADPSKAKDLIARVTGFGMVLFARSQPDTPGKLTAHAFSYEHMELAAYDLLAMVAERAGDLDTAEVARSIREQEAAMSQRLAANFDRAVAASLADVDPSDLEQQLVKYLADAHAIESQALQLLDAGPSISGEPGLGDLFRRHLEETRTHRETVEARLEAHGGGPSALQSAALRVGGLNMGGFFAAQPDTPAKLAGFAFAFEHLEVAGYEELSRVAQRAGDEQTVAAAARIIAEEYAAGRAIRERFGPALDAALEAQGVSA